MTLRQHFSLETLFLCGLCVVLLTNGALFVLRVRGFVMPAATLAQLARDPHAQTRAALGTVPYDVLQRAQTLLPRDARVLLVTDGQDAQHWEYTTYHRALYYLTPRAVLWLSPAANDGSWQARWWTSTPLTSEALLHAARERGTDFILSFADVRFDASVPRTDLNGATLYSLANAHVVSAENAPIEFADSSGWWRAIFALAAIFLLGAPFAWTRGRALRVASAWAMGAGVTALAMLLLNAFGVALSVQTLCLASLALASGIVSLARIRNVRLPSLPDSLSPPQIFLMLWTALQFLFVGVIALGQPLVFWDSWVVWAMKARAIFLEQHLGAAVFADSARAVTHLDYPLLLPSLEAWLFQWLGAPDDRFVGWLALAFFAALVGLTYGAARNLALRPTRAWLVTALVASLPTVTLLSAENYADIPFAVYALFTALALAAWNENGSRGAWAAAVFGALCLVWTKREGLVLVFALAGSIIFCAPRERRAWWGAVTTFGAGALGAGAWAWFLAAHGTRNIDFLPLTAETFWANVTRVPTIAFYFFQQFASAEFGFVWILIGLVRIARMFSVKNFARDVLLLAPLLYLVLMACAFIFSAFTPFASHLASAGYRLVAQVTPMAVLWLAAQWSLLRATAPTMQYAPR